MSLSRYAPLLGVPAVDLITIHIFSNIFRSKLSRQAAGVALGAVNLAVPFWFPSTGSHAFDAVLAGLSFYFSMFSIERVSLSSEKSANLTDVIFSCFPKIEHRLPPPKEKSGSLSAVRSAHPEQGKESSPSGFRLMVKFCTILIVFDLCRCIGVSTINLNQNWKSISWARFWITFLSGVSVWASFDGFYYLIKFIFVHVIPLSISEDWPVIFRSPHISDSWRDLWSYRWHQVFSDRFRALGWSFMKSLGFSVPWRIISVFLLSGLLHGYVLIAALPKDIPGSQKLHYFISIIWFFVLNGLILVAELYFEFRFKKERFGLPSSISRVLLFSFLLFSGWMFAEPFIEIVNERWVISPSGAIIEALGFEPIWHCK